MSRSKILSSVFGAAMAATMACATPAMALEARDCLPMAEMNAALRAEGQRTMIIGDREALQNPTGRIADASIHRFVNTVTSNEDGSVGYQLEGNLPRAQASTEVCVRAKLTNVRLFDARRSGIPSDALLGGQFDQAIRDTAERGTRPMVVADTVSRRPDGTERLGLPLVLLGNMEHRSGHMLTRLPNGQPEYMIQMADTDYTPAALQRLTVQVAMRSPD
jgi:hypothetical protein